MTEQEFALLITVKDACKKNPSLVAEVVSAANGGLSEKITELHRLNSDLECLAALAMAR